MLNLADTSIRMYRRKDGRVSLKLRSYLLVHTNTGFRLSAYLRDMSCQVELASGQIIKFEEISFTEETQAKYQFETMTHGFWASAITEMKVMENQVGKFRMDYLISFTGHPSEQPSSFQTIVPLVRRQTQYGYY